jgi:hypothetical protein
LLLEKAADDEEHHSGDFWPHFILVLCFADAQQQDIPSSSKTKD